jgi:hypothetical protein
MPSLVHRLKEAEELLGWRLPVTATLWLPRPKYLVIARDLDKPLPPVQSRMTTRWTLLTEREIPNLCAADPGLDPADARRRLDDGQECHVGWVDEELAHYRWETTRPTLLPYLGKILRPLPGQVCGCGAFTAPGFRRLGIHTESGILALHRKRERGMRTAIHFVAWWHRPSRRVYLGRAGCRLAGSIGYWNLGLRRRFFTEGAVRLDSPSTFCIDA